MDICAGPRRPGAWSDAPQAAASGLHHRRPQGASVPNSCENDREMAFRISCCRCLRAQEALPTAEFTTNPCRLRWYTQV